MSEELTSYKDTDDYQYLVEDCKNILAQRIKNSRMELIMAYGEVGERITNSKTYQKFAKGNQEVIQDIAKDIGISYSEACRAIQFYEKFGKDSLVSETITNQFEEGDNISWGKIKAKYLTDGFERKPPKKTFYKLNEIKEAFCRWFESSDGGNLKDELDKFLKILTK